MPKKKTKSAPKSTKKTTKSHGVLFDNHPNLIWLLPIFLIIAAIAVIAYNNSMKPDMSGMLNADQIPAVNLNSSGSAETPGY